MNGQVSSVVGQGSVKITPKCSDCALTLIGTLSLRNSPGERADKMSALRWIKKCVYFLRRKKAVPLDALIVTVLLVPETTTGVVTLFQVIGEERVGVS